LFDFFELQAAVIHAKPINTQQQIYNNPTLVYIVKDIYDVGKPEKLESLLYTQCNIEKPIHDNRVINEKEN
jgi:hypothetical protein